MPIVCAAHPADILGDNAVRLLQEVGGTEVVCVNPQSLAFEEMVDEIDAERQRRSIARWVFWGLSGGGWLGQIYARKYSDALDGVILESICSCFRMRLADPECILSPFHAQWRAMLDSRGLLDPHGGDDGATEWMEIDGVSIWRRENGPALMVSPMPVTDLMRRAMPRMWSFDARPWLHEIATPALVIAGSADPIAPVAHVRAVHEAIDGSEFLLVDGAGHVPTLARRAEVMDAARAFLRRV